MSEFYTQEGDSKTKVVPADPAIKARVYTEAGAKGNPDTSIVILENIDGKIGHAEGPTLAKALERAGNVTFPEGVKHSETGAAHAAPGTGAPRQR